MDEHTVTGAQRSYLRGLGQRLEPALKIGRDGLTPAVATELERQLRLHELVKVRFVAADRHERAALCERVAADSKSQCIGAVGHTALFFRRNADPGEQRIELPASGGGGAASA